MKNLSIKLIVLTFILLVTANTSFTATSSSNKILKLNTLTSNSLGITLLNQGEVVIKISSKDGNPNTTASIIFEVISTDGFQNLGTFSVTENELLELHVSHENWTFNVIDSSQDAELVYWFENI